MVSEVARKYESTVTAAAVRMLEIVNPAGVVLNYFGDKVSDRFRPDNGFNMVVPRSALEALRKRIESTGEIPFDTMSAIENVQVGKVNYQIAHLGRTYYLILNR